MAATESLPRTVFGHDHLSPTSLPKPIPILTGANVSHQDPAPPSPSDAMDITPTSAVSMAPPTNSPGSDRAAERQPAEPGNASPRTNANGNGSAVRNPSPNSNANGAATTNGTANLTSLGVAASANPTKVVQTAFIHKLYNMLEDPGIQHLISWSSGGESFVMNPSTEFSKVLAQYFKHTNISSFVRQLNMYGFHKVSDVFHNGPPDSTLWEFKHGNGSFKRGDLIGLREIKRRASRHTLINRDSFSTASKPLAPAQAVNQIPEALPGQDPADHRMTVIEHNYFDMHARLARSEDSIGYLLNKCQALTEGLIRCHLWNQDLAQYITTIVADPDNQLTHNISMMQREIARQTDFLRRVEAEGVEHQQPPAPFMNHVQESHGPPLSPRQMPVQDPSQRRPSHPSLFEPRNPPPSLRNHFAPHVMSSVSPRRYGSIGSNNAAYTPMGRAPLHPPQPPPPPTLLLQPRESHQHPLATVTTSPPAASHLSRRHTSADIRLHGWQGGSPPGGANGGPPPAGSSPFGSGAGGYWPSSPPRPVAAGAPNGGPGDQAIRDTLAQYELPRGPSKAGGGPVARQLTPPAGLDPMSAPPPPIGGSGGAVGAPGLSAAAAAGEAAWAVPGSRFPSYANKMYGGAAAAAAAAAPADGPPTARRSSMASNLHGLLNPASTAESGEEDEHASGESGGGGKRKRMG